MVLLNKKHPPKTNSHSGRTSWSPGSVYSSKKKWKKGITKQSCWKLNSDGVKGKANLLHTRQQEPHSPITTTLQEHQYTCGSLVLLRTGCIHSYSTSPIICEMEPLDKEVYCKLQVSILISQATKPYMSYVNRWIREGFKKNRGKCYHFPSWPPPPP